MASDGASYSTGGTFSESGPKIVEVGGRLVGASGYGPVLNMIQQWGIGAPLDILHKLVEAKLPGDWRVLVAGPEGVDELDDSLNLTHWSKGYGAIGVGETFCLGAMAVLIREIGPDPDILVEQTIGYAYEHVSDCRGAPLVLRGLLETGLDQ